MADIVASTTLGSAWDAAVRLGGDRPWLVYLPVHGERMEYTYAQFNVRVTRALACFSARGITKGTVVAIQLRNSPEFIATLLALAKLGAVSVPLGLGLTAAELLSLYLRCQAEWAVVDLETAEMNEAVHAEYGVLPGGVIRTHCDGTEQFEVPSQDQPSEVSPNQVHGDVSANQVHGDVSANQVRSDDVAEVMYTSGTTAEPKGVLVTHANMVYSGHYATWQCSLRPYDRIFTTMPACHSNFQLVALTGAIVAGSALVLCEHYSAHRFWHDVQEEHATVIQLTAMMVRTMLMQPVVVHEKRHTVRECLYFMPLSNEDKTAFEQRFGVRLMNSYGSTETICWVVTDPPQGERRWPSVGRAGLGYDVAIVDAAGNPLGPRQAGEFWVRGVRGRTLMAGYLDDPEATAAAFGQDGWMHTSDTGFYDEDGWFYFLDRSRNVIKRAGQNISASEVEAVLNSHPLIQEAAVIGVPDPVRDEAIKAFIQLMPDADLSTDQVDAYCRAQLAPYKVPQFVEFVTEFPRTSSMKIEKRSLN